MTIIKKFVSKIKSFGKKILEKMKNILSKSKILLTKSAFVLYYGFGLKQTVDFIIRCIKTGIELVLIFVKPRIRNGLAVYNAKYNKIEEEE